MQSISTHQSTSGTVMRVALKQGGMEEGGYGRKEDPDLYTLLYLMTMSG